MMLLDTTQLCLSSSFAFREQLKNTSDDKQKAKDILRHIILSCIKGYKKKYGAYYGKVVVCCDHKHYWRKDLFPEYKYLRKKARENSDLDWRLIFDTINEVTDDLRENFPYSVISVDGAESDDIIAVLTEEQAATHPELPILIVSSDKDFVQLHRFANVTQISPQSKKIIRVDDPVMFLKEKIIRGDKSDCIPNIFSDDKVFLEGRKQIAVTKKKLDEFMKIEEISQIKDENIRKYFIRNKTLIDFANIPESIKANIIAQFKQPVKGTRDKIFTYLVSHNCSALLNDIENF